MEINMEDQVNVGDQNTQPIGQNLTAQTAVPDKPKANHVAMFAVGLICSLVFGIGGYFLGKQSIPSSSSNRSDNNSIIPSEPSTTISLSPIGVTIPGWKNSTISSIGLAFQYPPNLEFVSDINDSTVLAGDKEYWVAVGGSDIIYLSTFLYKSVKTPSDWWNSDGKNRFEKLADEIENVMTPKAIVNLTYSQKQTTFAGKQAFEVVVTSDYESPHTPKQRYLTILQQNGYIVMLSYQDMGTTESSIDMSKQILSTFKFEN